LPLFYIGYGYETAARAALLCGDREKCGQQLVAAEALLATIDDGGEREVLVADLQELQG